MTGRGVYRRPWTRTPARRDRRRFVPTATAAAGPVYPAVGDVRSGVTYGPTGADYTGTYTASGGAAYSRGRVVNA